MKSMAQRIRKHLDKIRQLVANNPTPIFRKNKKEIIESLRKTREHIWEEKLATRH